MRSDKKIKPKNSGLVKVLYVLSAVLAIIFVYMLAVNIMYIQSYTASYGMDVSYVWQEAVQYVVTGSVSYLVYAVLLLSAGKIIKTVSEAPVVIKEVVEPSDIEDEEPSEMGAGFDPDRVINKINKEEKPVTEHLKQRKKKRNI